jgi:tetratricopeptide (TPR) repeat protein
MAGLPKASLNGSVRRESRYELGEQIGRGGMGTVHRAYDKLAARDVAYKRLIVPEARLRPRLVGLFQREYDTLARLVHPAIVDVYEYGFDELGPFYTMELLGGEGLMERAPLAAPELARVMRDVASALALLHTRRVLHRDLNPGNVRIVADARTKLIDFGALAPFGVAPDLVGAPPFVAPECLEGRVLDQRADLYALGALAYWCLTRRTAVRARSFQELPAALREPIEPPSRHAPEIPPALDALVLSLLQRDPRARPESAAEIMERLTAMFDLPAEPKEHEVAHSYLTNPALVGRSEPMRLLEHALKAVVDGRGQSLLIEAASGQGRSALLENLALRARIEGATLLRADAATAPEPFGLARSLVRVATTLHPDALPSGGGRDAYFQHLLNPNRPAPVDETWSPVQASERQARTLALMQEALLRCSAKSPTVVIVDELQRADAESLALLATLSAEARDGKLLLVLSGRKAAAESDAYAKIRSNSRQLTLEPLSGDQTEELIDNVFGRAANSQRLAHWLHERSGGNPGRCIDLTRVLLQRGLIRYTAGTFILPHDVGAEVPWDDSAAALLGRLADASQLARDVGVMLSLQEMPMRIDHLAAALGAGTREVVLALEALATRGVASLGGDRATLLDSSLREALQTTLDDARRRELHRRAARALLAEPARDGSLRMQAGMHLLKAGDEVEAVDLLTARGDGDFLSGTTPIPLLEAVLEVLRRQGRSDEQCLGVLVPLVRGGFFGDMRAQRRHLSQTLQALARVSGVTTMTWLAPRLGAKLALIVGVVVGLIRHVRVPKKMRYGTYPETVAALLSILSASAAACVCAFEPDHAFEIVRTFEPLRAFGPDSAPYLTIEFCLATAEVGAGRVGAARQRYERLLERFKRPVQGMNAEIHLQFNQGILHGLAQCKVSENDPDALRLADELERAHMFFAPHAQTVRMAQHGYHGKMAQFEEHRRHAELLALRGGISWSSVTLMTVRAAYVAMLTSDSVALVRVIGELERLSEIAPRVLLYRDAARAFLAILRGRPEQAARDYEQLFARPEAAHMMTHWLDRALYTRALMAVQRHADAKRVCEEILAGFGPLDTIYTRQIPLQQLALAEAALGDAEGAAQRLDALLEQVVPQGNPLASGSSHRARARVGLLAGDMAAFERHARAMRDYFAQTENPCLIQQYEQLLQAAARAQAEGEQRSAARDHAALALEVAALPITVDDMRSFETEALVEPGNSRDLTG